MSLLCLVRWDAVGVPAHEEVFFLASYNARGYIVRVDHTNLETVRAKHDVVREPATLILQLPSQ